MKVYKKNVYSATKVECTLNEKNDIVKFSASKFDYESIFIEIKEGVFVELNDLLASNLPDEIAIKTSTKYYTYPTKENLTCVCNLKKVYQTTKADNDATIDILDIQSSHNAIL